MPDSPSQRSGLVAELRDILKDTNYAWPQMDFSVNTGTTAVLEVTDDSLIVTATGAPSNIYSFSSYPSIELLVGALQAIPDYSTSVISDAEPGHDSTDLQILPPTDVLGKTIQLSTRRFSDGELTAFLDRAVNRHNMSVPSDPTLQFKGNYNLLSLPSRHRYFVLLLAQIESLKTNIQSGIKRKGLDLTVVDFVNLKTALEREYAASLKLFVEAKPPLTEQQTHDLGSGDIIIGQSYRTTLHTTYRYPWGPRVVPYGVAPAPSREHLRAAVLSGSRVRLQWSQNRDQHFHRYEVWRGTSEDISNISDTNNPYPAVTPTGARVFSQYFQDRVYWVDTLPAPGTYYYVVYVFNTNNDSTPTNVVSVQVV